MDLEQPEELSFKELHKALLALQNKKQAQLLARFFKTGKGQYGEGDIFFGIKVPVTRGAIKQFTKMLITEIQKALESEIHEERLAGLLILVKQFEQAQKSSNEKTMHTIFNFYLSNTEHINNLDLVDLSSHEIVGQYILTHPSERKVLEVLARSEKKGRNKLQWLWERRIAIVSTAALIHEMQFEETLKISKMLLGEKHDLLHKAVGWMLREVGKRNEQVLEKFLRENHAKLPRTTLRYAIERFPEKKRKAFLQGNF